MTEEIIMTQEEGVLRLRIARETKKNALTQEMYLTLAEAMEGVPDMPEIGAVLFEGSDEIFTAGNDLSAFVTAPPADGSKPPVWRLLEATARCPVPVIAAVAGPAIGIGTTLLLHCDLIVAAPEAYFHTPFVDLAAVPEGGASYLMPKRLGRQLASEFLLLSRPVPAQRAYEMGFVNAVVTEGPVRDYGFDLAKDLAAKPREAMRQSKALMCHETDDMLAHMETEFREFAKRLSSDEMKSVIMAMMQRKKG
ncbi:Enoyl-CoA hydratase/isomerase family protein [Parvularcula bermudensis HTCC2503]|uniref:Enoyl-CoA hydratase/isomerase family protein n=1 Tax=Parvularcula bermudensis (strain ATCC BAA-594 / HTCC2503 / KCTC 12087) TaxID=314260 RepID=E0TBT8_PARBH|nr:enoyl-CoA hydratase-related protein [Parvularcula bermudensis]ADM08431.1 Enoyl-CoA hydratase/isomerase family protein [Parvularcula bermudensis HTCC2503]